MSPLSGPGKALDMYPSSSFEKSRSGLHATVDNTKIQDRISAKAVVRRSNERISPAANYRCHLPQCAHRKPFRNDSEMRRHMATHTRPFACKENACASKPFGDKAGLMRHLREVHGQQVQGQAPQTFMCPEPNCKRHRRGFPREYNMLEHHRRLHEKPAIGNTILEEPGSGQNGDQTTIARQVYSNSISGTHSESDDADLGTADTFDVVHQQDRSGSETALQVLQVELKGLKAQKEQALQAFDQQIVAISTALRVVGQRLQSTMAVE
ncbi:hypothetical protein MMC22_003978 [Lobaria immixta]|nr:hypothetical protein [Lobaria immixta]